MRKVHFVAYTNADLNSLDVFLWGFVKDKVYVSSVHATLTTGRTAKTAQPLLQNVWHKVEHRLDVC
jgi:hypothetical protein